MGRALWTLPYTRSASFTACSGFGSPVDSSVVHRSHPFTVGGFERSYLPRPSQHVDEPHLSKAQRDEQRAYGALCRLFRLVLQGTVGARLPLESLLRQIKELGGLR